MLRKKGYVFVCDPYRRYATIRSLSAKKCMRTFRLGAEYDKEALQDRLLENQRDIRVTRRYFEFMRPYTRGICQEKSADGKILPAAGFLSAFAPCHRIFELLPLCGNRAGRCAAVRKRSIGSPCRRSAGRLAAGWIASPPR